LKKSGNELSSELDIGYDPLSRCRTIDKVLDQLRDRHGEEAIFFAGSQMF
jgi:hypothetical protein